MTKRLDIVLPAYNPTKGWELYALSRIHELERLRPEWQIHLYVSADGSTRGHEREVLTTLAEGMQGEFTHIDYGENRGKGAALRAAVEQTVAQYVLYTDWDFPFTTGSYLDALDALGEGADVVLPVRDTSLYMQHLGRFRRCLSSASRLMNSTLLLLPASDTQGGIKAFSARGRSVFLKTRIKRFLFDTEFIALSVRLGVSVSLTSCSVRSGIIMSGMGLSTLRRELGNIARLFYARYFHPRL